MAAPTWSGSPRGSWPRAASKSSADTARRVADARERLAGQSWHGGQRPWSGTGTTRTGRSPSKTLVGRRGRGRRDQAGRRGHAGPGHSLKAVARDLRDRGVPTVTGARVAGSNAEGHADQAVLAGIFTDGGAELAGAVVTAVLDRGPVASGCGTS